MGEGQYFRLLGAKFNDFLITKMKLCDGL